MWGLMSCRGMVAMCAPYVLASGVLFCACLFAEGGKALGSVNHKQLHERVST